MKLYFELPGWFEVPTSLGGYIPDWAVLVETDERGRLYFVVETKGTLYVGDLTNRESAKIRCGRAHFEAMRIGEGAAEYVVAQTLDDVLARAG